MRSLRLSKSAQGRRVGRGRAEIYTQVFQIWTGFPQVGWRPGEGLFSRCTCLGVAFLHPSPSLHIGSLRRSLALVLIFSSGGFLFFFNVDSCQHRGPVFFCKSFWAYYTRTEEEHMRMCVPCARTFGCISSLVWGSAKLSFGKEQHCCSVSSWLIPVAAIMKNKPHLSPSLVTFRIFCVFFFPP